MDAALKIDNPRSLGFAPERLALIDDFFHNYIEKKRLAGLSYLIARGGKVAHCACDGVLSLDSDKKITEDSLFRIYSMTKPITSLALMMLFQKGLLRLDQPLSKFLPEFKNTQIWAGGNNLKPQTRPALRQINIRDLLTHCSGLTYGFMHSHPIDRFYRQKKIGENVMTLEDTVKTAAQLPLLFDPGEHWNYSIATDVCGRLIEVLSGQRLDVFFTEHIFKPLKMNDTDFFVPSDKLDRFMANYNIHPQSGALNLIDPNNASSAFAKPPTYLSGGGGLVSTMGDYLRFCQMLSNGGELDGVRLLSPNIVEFMRDNHLPHRADLSDISISTFSENLYDGTGFGLGFCVVMDNAAMMMPISEGSYFWGGAASTFFWIDPMEDLIVIFMTQFMPSDYYPLRPQLQQLTYSALI